MSNKKHFTLHSMTVTLLFILMFISSAHALQTPRPIATDNRIMTARYSPNEVYKFTGHYGYQSIIEFAREEEILMVSIGDSVSWQVNPSGYRLFIKPIEQDAMTNMAVITTRGTYHFELHAEETENIRDKNLIFVLRFVYPEEYGENFTNYLDVVSVPDLEDPEVFDRLNFNYSIQGPDIIAPIRIFDDGEFTYFQFRDVNAEVPAFFYVDPDGSEGIINFRTRDDYIVVERVSPKFTLRNGPYVICVTNENMPMEQHVAPVEDGDWLRRNFGI